MPEPTIIAALAAAGGAIAAKGIDFLISRNSAALSQSTAIGVRQRELDSMKDSLILTFEIQMRSVRKDMQEVEERNEQLYTDNIRLRYIIANMEYQINLLRQKLNLEPVSMVEQIEMSAIHATAQQKQPQQTPNK